MTGAVGSATYSQRHMKIRGILLRQCAVESILLAARARVTRSPDQQHRNCHQRDEQQYRL